MLKTLAFLYSAWDNRAISKVPTLTAREPRLIVLPPAAKVTLSHLEAARFSSTVFRNGTTWLAAIILHPHFWLGCTVFSLGTSVCWTPKCYLVVFKHRYTELTVGGSEKTHGSFID